MLSEPLKQNQQVESSEGFNPTPVLNSHIFEGTSEAPAHFPQFIYQNAIYLSVATRNHLEAKSGHSELDGEWQAGRQEQNVFNDSV